MEDALGTFPARDTSITLELLALVVAKEADTLATTVPYCPRAV